MHFIIVYILLVPLIPLFYALKHVYNDINYIQNLQD